MSRGQATGAVGADVLRIGIIGNAMLARKSISVLTGVSARNRNSKGNSETKKSCSLAARKGKRPMNGNDTRQSRRSAQKSGGRSCCRYNVATRSPDLIRHPLAVLHLCLQVLP